jgi:hypothetical protein
VSARITDAGVHFSKIHPDRPGMMINCFSNCGIVGLRVTNSVREIGTRGFIGCAKLGALVFDGHLVRELLGFQNLGLSTIVVPAPVLTRGDAAFENCMAAAEVRSDEPSQVETVNSFARCGLVSVRLPGSARKVWEKGSKDCNMFESVTLHVGLEILDGLEGRRARWCRIL